jgi:hypothetical protein
LRISCFEKFQYFRSCFAVCTTLLFFSFAGEKKIKERR